MQEARKQSRGSADGFRGNQYTELVKGQNEPLPKSTAQKIAEEVGVSESTVKRAEKFSKGIDTLGEVSKEAVDKVLRGVNLAYTLFIFIQLLCGHATVGQVQYPAHIRQNPPGFTVNQDSSHGDFPIIEKRRLRCHKGNHHGVAEDGTREKGGGGKGYHQQHILSVSKTDTQKRGRGKLPGLCPQKWGKERIITQKNKIC